MELTPPDVLLFGPKWPERALLRAELIEAGYDAVAIEAWPMPGLYRRHGMKPRMAIVDLQGLPEPRILLDELRLILPPQRVLVITALGTLTVDAVRQMGYQVVARPTSIRDIVAATTKLLAASGTFRRKPSGVTRA